MIKCRRFPQRSLETIAHARSPSAKAIHRLFPAVGAKPDTTGFSARVARVRSIWLRDESRRQHLVSGDHLRGSDPRIAAAVRMGAEYRDLCRGMVGLRRSFASGLDHAVRHVWHGLGSDLDRSRQCPSVHRVRADLDRCARIRPPPAAADPVVRRRRAVAGAVPRSERRGFVGHPRAFELRHHHRLYLGNGV